MQLYSFFNSSTSYRVRIALALKGLSWDTTGINIRQGQQRSADHLERNPSAAVPTLVDGDTTLSQSMAIIDYIDTVHPAGPRLIPLEQPLRARVLELSSVFACDIHPINNLRVLAYLTQTLGADDEKRNAWYRHWMAEGLRAAETLLERHGGEPFCFGTAPTLADCCLVPQVANALRMGCDTDAYPHLMRVHRHASAQPAFVLASPASQLDFIA